MPSIAEEMGNICSKPSTTCCKRKACFPPFSRHAENCKRIKYTIVPQSDPDAPKTSPNNNRNRNGNGNSGSPHTLQRSNAIRRAPAERSRSSSPSLFSPARLRVRNVTPPPARPTSIVPTLMLNGTPSTNQTSLSRSTAPTSPTTVISSVHHSGADRPTTLYMVDGEVIGSEVEGSPRLELRWIDALRVPGAGGYRTVVDVVEERRSGRLTVVNGRASMETTESGRNGGMGQNISRQQQQEMVQVSPTNLGSTCNGHMMSELPAEQQQQQQQQEWPDINPLAPTVGVPTKRAILEDEAQEKKQQQQQKQQQAQQLCLTPIRRKPVPKNKNPITGQSPSATSDPNSNSNDPQMFYQRRKAPMNRPPLPTFTTVNVTEKELLDEVEDAKRIVERKHEEKEEEDNEMELDWFWVDERGELRYRRGGLMEVE
ncbi:MAG: hypothetical protein Q9225_005842 [Loekoesia sp. 1 TL-2023]